ncbi:type IIL restriction-modification enzyme MmeI [uncultured Maribacter sp.]|uniref:type IIL restriction-modification enzyme MmeI n=1 Tax=uncultured Maribacter sp. TaxID=431308 RepID=UPI0026396A07|nr:type IIL restriction-modification enzyme MmeI [uncultured Maribacter sp.]
MQPIFTQNFLSHYLNEFKLSNVPNIKYIRSVISNLTKELKSGKLESLKEEEFKSRFLNEVFGDVLGYNYGNSSFWTLREEVKTKIDGSKPDGALGFFSIDKTKDDVRAVIEIKNALTKLDEKQKRTDSKSPISQAFEYSSKMGENCRWVIVSNFKEIRFYSSKFQGKYQCYNLNELSNEENLKEILFLFHKDKFIKKHSKSSTDNLYKTNSLNLKENEKPKHIVDEIYSSLYRFKGLNYVDPIYIANIKPFNILDEYVWHFENGNLVTINPKIFKLFNELDFEKGLIKISKKLKQELKESKVIEYEDKL